MTESVPTRRARRRRRCPACAQVAGVPVVYGFPGPEAIAASRRGELVLGGCAVVIADGESRLPDYACQACGHEWARA